MSCKSVQMIMPDNIRTARAKLFYWLSYHEYRFNQGRHTVGKVTGLLPEAGWIVAGYMYITNTKPSPVQLILFAGACFIALYLLGTVWRHFNLDRIQSQVISERDPIKKAVYDVVTNGEGEKL